MVRRLPGLGAFPDISASGGTPTVQQANPSAGADAASAFASVSRAAEDINRRLQPIRDQNAQQQALEDAETAALQSEQEGRVITPELRRAFTREDQIYNQTVTQLTHARTMNDARAAFEEMRREHAYSPQEFDAAARAWRDSYIGNLQSPFRVELEAAVDRMSLDYGLRVQDERRERDGRRAVEQTTKLVDDNVARMFNMLLADSDAASSEEYQELRRTALEALDGLYSNPSIPGWYENDTALSEAVEALEASEERAISFGALDGLMATQGFEAAFEAADQMPARLGLGEEEGQAFVADAYRHINRQRIRADRQDAERERAEREATRETARRQTSRYLELQRGVADGSVTLDEVEGAFSQGEISEGHYTAFYVSMAANERERAALLARLEAGPLDPGNRDDREAVELLYNVGLENQEEGSDPSTVLRSVIAEHGIVPETAQSRLRATALSTDPEAASAALDEIAMIEELSPSAADAAFSSGLLGDARVYANRVQNGVPVESAIEHIFMARQPDQPGRELRVARARQVSEDLDAAAVEQLFDEGGWPWRARPAFDDPIMRDAAVSTYRQLYQDAYTRFGSEDDARRFAESSLRRTYGVTQVGGEQRIMAVPPERSYPDYGDRGAWMNEQLAAGVIERAETLGITLPSTGSFGGAVNVPGENAIDAIVERTQLVADRRTVQERNIGRAPTYKMVVEDVEGVMHELPGRFMFDDAAVRDERQAEMRTAASQTVESARQTRELFQATAMERDERLRERAIREWLMTDFGGGETAVGDFDRWRRENPNAPAITYPGLLAPSMFEAQ